LTRAARGHPATPPWSTAAVSKLIVIIILWFAVMYLITQAMITATTVGLLTIMGM
jgi:hypothetical protein